MKILQVNNYGYLKGGSEKVFFETIQILEDNGHMVKAFCMYNEHNNDSTNIVQAKIHPYENRKGLFGTISAIKNFFFNKEVEKEFSELVAKFKPDIIHIHIIYGRLTNAIIRVATKFNVPIVQSVHEFRLLCPVYTCLDSKGKVCEDCASSLFNLNCIRKRCSKGQILNSILVAAECKYRDIFYNFQKGISGFIMVSKFIEKKHIEYYPNIKDKCFQVYNSIDVSSYNRFVSLCKYNQERYYLYFGRLSYEKGLLSLIDYFKKHPERKLKIIGTGPLLSRIQEILTENSLDNIDVLGYKSGEILYQYVANAYFTIVPSEWYENNPLTIIESLALGTPVIGNNIGGIPEIIRDSETGYVYDYRKNDDYSRCMEYSYNLTEEEYKKMVIRCTEEAYEMFDKKRYYEKLMNVYNSVLNKCK